MAYSNPGQTVERWTYSQKLPQKKAIQHVDGGTARSAAKSKSPCSKIFINTEQT